MKPEQREKIEKGGLLAKVIIEVLGTPKEHVEKTLKSVIEKIKEDESLDVMKGKVFKAKPQGKFFSMFTEMEILFDGFSNLATFCLDYLPSSVEIIEPTNFKTESVNITHVLNDLLAKLHNIDMVLKSVQAKNLILERNSQNLLKNIVVLSLKDGKKKSVTELSKATGINVKALEPFLNNYLKEGVIKKVGKKYVLR